MSVEFLLTSFVIVVTPGTGVLFTMAAGLGRGARASVVAALGCTLGIVPHMAAAITGLAALLHTSAVAFSVLKYAGVAYLLWMAWSTLRDRSALAPAQAAEAAPVSSARVIGSAVLVNVLNPKLTIFFFAFLPQFVGRDQFAVLPRMLELSGVFMAMTFVVFVGYGLVAALLRHQVVSRPGVLTWLRRTFAAAFLGMGVRLALADR
jgi:threonine/homoserine/homoserine lactone efflux protein